MENELITISKKELSSKTSNLSKISFGTGIIAAGALLLFDKKVVDKTKPISFIIGGTIIIGFSILFRWIDKMPDSSTSNE